MPRRTPNIFFGLSWFDKQTEELVGEIPLEISARELRRLLHLRSRTPLTDSYPVARRHVAFLKALVSQPLNLAQFNYFIEASNSPVPAHEHAIR
jgi:hypothetical protein